MRKCILILSAVLVLIACKSPINGSDNNHPCDVLRENFFLFEILKLEYPEYLDNVTINEYCVKDSFCWTYWGVNSMFLPSKRAENPLVELGDGYYITNWYVLYPFYGYGHQENHIAPCIINKKWEDVKGKACGPLFTRPWDDIEVLARFPASELYTIDYPVLDAYFGVNQTEMLPAKFRTVAQGLVAPEMTCDSIYIEGRCGAGSYHECVEACTKIGEMYVDLVKQLYDSGVLFDLAQRMTDYDDLRERYLQTHKE